MRLVRYILLGLKRRSIPVICVVIWAVSTTAAAQTSKAEMQTIVHQFLKCWETNDIQTLDELLHEDLIFAYPGDRLNKSQLLQMFADYQTEKKDIKIYLWDTFLTSENKFASAYQFAATDNTSGKRQAVGTGVVGEIQNGKIVLFKEYFDESVATLQYQGKLPLDEGDVTPWPSSIWLRPETID